MDSLTLAILLVLGAVVIIGFIMGIIAVRNGEERKEGMF